MKLLAAAAVGLLAAAPAAASPMHWAVQPRVLRQPASFGGTAVVGVVPGASDAAVAARNGVAVASVVRGLDAFVARGGDAALHALATDPAVRYVEPVTHLADLHARDDPLTTAIDPGTGAPVEWAFTRVHVDEALNVAQGDPSMLVGIVDTGVADVPDLAGKIANTLWFPDQGTDATDTDGHGTFVASIIAANNDDSFGLAGFCGACRLVVFRDVVSSSVTNAEAIQQLVDAGVKIINFSRGGYGASLVLEDAVNYAVAHGVLFVASAGNDDVPRVTYPAAWVAGADGAAGAGLAVGASDYRNRRASFSNYGPYLSLLAPGTYDSGCMYGIVGALPRVASDFDGGADCAHTFTADGARYAYASGTSFAAPEVAGVAALVWAARPDYTAAQVASVLEQTANRGGSASWSSTRGWGILDAAAAVAYATGKPDGDTVSITGISTSHAVAGRTLTASVEAQWQDDEPASGQLHCAARVGSRAIAAFDTTLTAGTGRCSWKLARNAGGRTVTITATVTDGNGNVARGRTQTRVAPA